MATVILLRHGRTAANAQGILAGRTRGVRLDETGSQQGSDAADRLAGLRLAAIVSSPMQRCRQTGALVARRQATPIAVRTDKDLAEVDYGTWAGRPLKELAKEPLWRTVQAHPAGVEFPGGESLASMSARVVRAVRRWDADIETEHGPQAVLVVVSHGDPIKAVLADALGTHLDAFQRIVVDPASLSVIRYTPLRPFVLTMNSTSGDLGHLSPPKPKSRRAARKPSSDATLGGETGRPNRAG